MTARLLDAGAGASGVDSRLSGRSVAGRGAVALVLAVVVAVLGCAVLASVASAATGFARVGGFLETPADGSTLHFNERIAVEHSTGNGLKTDVAGDRVVVYGPTGFGPVELTTFGSGELVDPFGVAVDQVSGDVYVSDENHVVKYNSDGAATPAFAVDPGFTSPGVTGPLAFDQANNQLLVGDKATNAVRRYSTTGGAVSSFDGSAGSGSPGAFTSLQDLAVDSTGDVLVVDSDGDPASGDTGRVERFDAAGSYEASLGPVSAPATVAVRPSDDAVFVSGGQNAVDLDATPTVTVFDTAGTEIGRLPVDGSVTYSTISGLAIDDGTAGRIYVATDVSGGRNYAGQYGLASVQVYEQVELPDVTADPATAVTQTTATLRGTIDAHGAEATYYFEYSGDGGGSWTQTPVQGPVDAHASIPVLAKVTGLSDATHYDFRLVGTRAGADATSPSLGFDTIDGDPPAVVLGAESDLTPASATLNGTVNPNGIATTYRFEYSPDGGATFTALPGADGDPGVDDPIGAGSSDVAISGPVTDLQPGTQYPYHLIATNAIGTSQADGTFTTTSVPAEVDTTAATNVTFDTAKLNGTVNAHNDPATYHFEYGTDTTYGTSTPDSDGGASNDAKTAAATLTGLDPSTTYHYKLVADNGTGGPVSGPDETFTTLDQPPTPVTGAATDVTTSAATLHGTVDTHGLAGTFSFSVTQLDGTHIDPTAVAAVPAGTGPVAVAAPITGLPAGGTYITRLSVTTSAGARSGSPQMFSTAPKPPFIPPPPPAVEIGSTYGCDNPHLDAFNAKVKPGQAIALTGSDLGVDGTLGIGGQTVQIESYSSTRVTAIVPAGLKGTVPLTLNCGKATNTVALAILTSPANTFTIKTSVKRSIATLKVTVPGPGRITVRGTRLHATTAETTARGTKTLRLSLTAAGKRALAKTRWLRIRTTIRFTPTGGTTRTATRTITFTRKASR